MLRPETRCQLSSSDAARRRRDLAEVYSCVPLRPPVPRVAPGRGRGRAKETVSMVEAAQAGNLHSDATKLRHFTVGAPTARCHTARGCIRGFEFLEVAVFRWPTAAPRKDWQGISGFADPEV
ncbi:hypothetical protein HPB50_029426 [Hyalomma asiaticum]|nr:hypothetical protein HPB50_029426 [Hyalomma asiaticum]